MFDCKEEKELFTGVGALSIDGEPTLDNVELLALVELRHCKSSFMGEGVMVILNNILKVGVVINGSEYVLGGFSRVGDDITHVVTSVYTYNNGEMIGEALVEGGWVKLPECSNCGEAVRRVINAVNSGYAVFITLDLKGRRVISVDLVSPRRAREIMNNWYLRTTPTR